MATTKKTTRRTKATKQAPASATKRRTRAAKPKATENPTPARNNATGATGAATKANKAKAAKGQGVIATIIELLTAASAKNPLTKQALCDELAERFPDREPRAMMRTINCQVPSRLRSDKEIEVQKNDKGYWING